MDPHFFVFHMKFNLNINYIKVEFYFIFYIIKKFYLNKSNIEEPLLGT